MTSAGPLTADELAALAVLAERTHKPITLRLIAMIDARDRVIADLSESAQRSQDELALLRTLERYVRTGEDFVDEALQALEIWRAKQRSEVAP